MSSNTPFPPILPGDDPADDGAVGATKDVDGAEVLDPDADADLIDSADADVLASVDPDDQ